MMYWIEITWAHRSKNWFQDARTMTLLLISVRKAIVEEKSRFEIANPGFISTVTKIEIRLVQ